MKDHVFRAGYEDGLNVGMEEGYMQGYSQGIYQSFNLFKELADYVIEIEQDTSEQAQKIHRLIEDVLKKLKKQLTQIDKLNISKVDKILSLLNWEILSEFHKQIGASGSTTGFSSLVNSIGQNKSDAVGAVVVVNNLSDVFLYLLAVSLLYKNKQHNSLTMVCKDLISFSKEYPKSDYLLSMAIYYYSLVHMGNLKSIKPFLMDLYRFCLLKKKHESVAVLINFIVLSFLECKEYVEADLFLDKVNFPFNHSKNSQIARFLYYSGRVKAIRLEYSESLNLLQQAIRKSGAIGFHQHLYKLYVLVVLLTGDIPDRNIFDIKYLRKCLLPYLHLVKSVRSGELKVFENVSLQFASVFAKDGLDGLVKRLRHTVIKTGLKSISLAYSRISLRDITLKLGLDCEESVEYIIVKAIKDNVMTGAIIHESGIYKSIECVDLYSGKEPEIAFEERIGFLMQCAESCTKALRYPNKKNITSDLVTSEDLREIEREIAEMEEDGDDLGF